MVKSPGTLQNLHCNIFHAQYVSAADLPARSNIIIRINALLDHHGTLGEPAWLPSERQVPSIEGSLADHSA